MRFLRNQVLPWSSCSNNNNGVNLIIILFDFTGKLDSIFSVDVGEIRIVVHSKILPHILGGLHG